MLYKISFQTSNHTFVYHNFPSMCNLHCISGLVMFPSYILQLVIGCSAQLIHNTADPGLVAGCSLCCAPNQPSIVLRSRSRLHEDVSPRIVYTFRIVYHCYGGVGFWWWEWWWGLYGGQTDRLQGGRAHILDEG